MSLYYLIPQLPSLDGIADNSPLPITEERFLSICGELLSKKAWRELGELTLVPNTDLKKSGSALIDRWNEGERDLRLALAGARAKKLGKHFENDGKALPTEISKLAATAIEAKDPLIAERCLCEYRLSFLESLRPINTFSEDYLYYYGLKLKLLLRMRKFSTGEGETAYRNIYSSILNGERSEDKR